jgi:hypothetical protein
MSELLVHLCDLGRHCRLPVNTKRWCNVSDGNEHDNVLVIRVAIGTDDLISVSLSIMP